MAAAFRYSVLFAFVSLAIVHRASTDSDKPCISRKYDHASIVCVCNATYCDEIDPIKPLPPSHYVAYCSSMAGLRFEKSTGQLKKSEKSKPPNDPQLWNFLFASEFPEITITIRKSYQRQRIVGFGATFTDSAGINIKSLSKPAQKKLMKSYFGKTGIEYNLCRVPIGGTDFSTRPYAYNMEPKNDVNLSNYTLTLEDLEYKIPYIQQASEVATDDIYLIATAWSPPTWMKTSTHLDGQGQIYLKYYQTWADYHLKFLELYDKHNIKFWGITTGNEPTLGFLKALVKINSVGLMPWQQGHWIAKNFGPTLRKSRFKNIKIFGIDDFKPFHKMWLDELADNYDAFKYFDGIATHWYGDKEHRNTRDFEPNIHHRFPNQMVISTEASSGHDEKVILQVKLGNWESAEEYLKSMFFDFGALWYQGWIEWNLVLDEEGGPTWTDNAVDASIIAVSQKDEFLKQPTFYALGHFSKFLPRGSINVETKIENGMIENIAFLRPDGGITVIISNLQDFDVRVKLQDDFKGFEHFNIPKHSIMSIVYW